MAMSSLASRAGKFFGLSAILVGLFALVFGHLSDHARYEVGSRLVYPLFRMLWVSGYVTKFILQRVDGRSNLALPAGFYNKEWWSKVDSWQPGEEDVIIATFPKSGTHFTMQMNLQIRSNASDATADFETVHTHIAVVETFRPDMIPASTPNKEDLLFLNNYREKSPLKPFLHATHLDYEHTYHSGAAKYVVMVRDPLDVLKSFHSATLKMGRLAPAANELMPFLTEMFGGWAAWHRGWWMHRSDPNVLILFYADAVNRPADAASQIMRFLGREVDQDVLARVVERCSFPYMKKRGQAFEAPIAPPVLPFMPPQGNHGMINQGQIGGGKSLFSDEVRAMVREYCRRVLAGIDFPFDVLPSCK